MVKIYTARHGESIANTEGIYQGQTYDKGLSELGIKQARKLASVLLNKNIEQIISSPLMRTSQTANIISERLGIPVNFEYQIIETNHGVWEGKKKDWITDNYPQIIKTWQTNPADTVFPQGESFSQIIERVYDYIYQTNWVKNTLLVTHDNIIRIMVALAQDMDMNDIWEIDLDPAGLTIFSIEGMNGTKRLNLSKLNEIDHLTEFRSNISSHAL